MAESGAIDPRSAPTDENCRLVVSVVPALLADRVAWKDAALQATRLSSVLPAARADLSDKKYAMHEMTKAFGVYPKEVVSWVADHLMATCLYRPVPAEIHQAAKARVTRLRVAEEAARRLVSAREAALVERRRIEGEARDEAQALAEGRETPSQRRARVAREAIRSVRGESQSSSIEAGA